MAPSLLEKRDKEAIFAARFQALHWRYLLYNRHKLVCSAFVVYVTMHVKSIYKLCSKEFD